MALGLSLIRAAEARLGGRGILVRDGGGALILVRDGDPPVPQAPARPHPSHPIHPLI